MKIKSVVRKMAQIALELEKLAPRSRKDSCGLPSRLCLVPCSHAPERKHSLATHRRGEGFSGNTPPRRGVFWQQPLDVTPQHTRVTFIEVAACCHQGEKMLQQTQRQRRNEGVGSLVNLSCGVHQEWDAMRAVMKKKTGEEVATQKRRGFVAPQKILWRGCHAR